MRMQALRAGAVEFMAKPFNDEALLESVRWLWKLSPLIEACIGVRKESSVAAVARFGSGGQDRNPRRFEQIIGNSPALEVVLEQVERVAPTDSTVLIEEKRTARS